MIDGLYQHWVITNYGTYVIGVDEDGTVKAGNGEMREFVGKKFFVLMERADRERWIVRDANPISDK